MAQIFVALYNCRIDVALLQHRFEIVCRSAATAYHDIAHGLFVCTDCFEQFCYFVIGSGYADYIFWLYYKAAVRNKSHVVAQDAAYKKTYI